MATRDHVILFLNGKRCEIRGADCFLSLSDYLRYRRGLVGTKIVCSEGDCGSCTVLVGQPQANEIVYQPIDSCIRFMFQLEGVHIVTVEGLGGSDGCQENELTPIQQAMVDCHGSQCGFCTPGFVMAMHGLCEEYNGQKPSEEDWRHGLTGNLCRCTGYTPILEAGKRAAGQGIAKLNEFYPAAPIVRELSGLAGDTPDLRSPDGKRAYCPASLDDAIEFRRANPQAKIVAGATDVGVQLNKRVIEPVVFLDLNRVKELEGVEIASNDGEKAIVAGTRATWTQLLDVCQDAAPQFAEIVSVFGSPQIRHVGTIGGNVINASPIADSLPFMFVMDAELELVGPSGSRWVNINDFYQGYKKFDLRPDELLARIRISLPGQDELLRLFKVTRRRDLDISTFTAAIRLRLDGDTIEQAALAYGAVGPTVVRLRKTEQFLQGKPFGEGTMQAAGDLAVSEITPISDVRGSSDYRYQLARNILMKFYYEQQLAIA
jgi:xanthine dehydrogenase small subunit